MRRSNKNQIILFTVLIALVFSISYTRFNRIPNEKNSNSLNAETERITLDHFEIKTSGDNNFSALWISDNIGSVEGISIGDQDGDGKGEIILGAGPYMKVFEYNATYNNYTNVYTSEFIGSPYAAIAGDDLDKDGKKEIIIGDFSDFYFNIREFNGIDNDYDIVYQMGLGSDSFLEDLCVGNDLDGDGRMEIVIGDNEYLNVSEYNGADDGYTDIWESGALSSYISDICTTNDLDEDGQAEIIVAAGTTYVFENNGANSFTQVWSKTDNAYSVCIGDDLDKDGKKEIITGANDEVVIVYEHDKTDNGYGQVWNSSGKATNVKAVCVGNDLDGDGKNEIITGSFNGLVTIFEYNGTDDGYSKIWDSGTIINKLIENMAVADDHNKDGKKELIVTTNGGAPNKLYVFQHNDTVPSAPPSPTYIFIEDDDDDDDDDDEEGIFISNQILLIGGAIAGVVLVVVVIILIKRKSGSGR